MHSYVQQNRTNNARRQQVYLDAIIKCAIAVSFAEDVERPYPEPVRRARGSPVAGSGWLKSPVRRYRHRSIDVHYCLAVADRGRHRSLLFPGATRNEGRAHSGIAARVTWLGGETRGRISANGHLAPVIEELFPGAETADFEGTVTVASDGGEIFGAAVDLGSGYRTGRHSGYSGFGCPRWCPSI
jgi:hypothetical protein